MAAPPHADIDKTEHHQDTGHSEDGAKPSRKNWFGKLAARIAGALLVASGLFLGLWGILVFAATRSTAESEIIDFSPTDVSAEFASAIFFSIDDNLWYSKNLSTAAPPLYVGHLEVSEPSPDGTMLAAVSSGQLWIFYADGRRPLLVAPVESIFTNPPKATDERPDGSNEALVFYRDTDFHWSANSQELYLIKDQHPASDSTDSKLFSPHAQLVEFALATQKIQPVIQPFSASEYAVDGDASRVIFWASNANGEVHAYVQDEHGVAQVYDITATEYVLDKNVRCRFDTPLNLRLPDATYAGMVTRNLGIAFHDDDTLRTKRYLHVSIDGNKVLTLLKGTGLKGDSYAIDYAWQALPGERFFLTRTRTKQHRGTLVIDKTTGKYQAIAGTVRAHIPLTTRTVKGWKFENDVITLTR